MQRASSCAAPYVRSEHTTPLTGGWPAFPPAIGGYYDYATGALTSAVAGGYRLHDSTGLLRVRLTAVLRTRRRKGA